MPDAGAGSGGTQESGRIGGSAAAAATTAPQSPFDGPWYYPAPYLHRLPIPVRPIVPDYPANAGQRSGRVEFELFLGVDGRIDKLDVIEADPQGVFEEAVIAAFRAVAQTPGYIAGIPVKSRLRIEVMFHSGQASIMNLKDAGPHWSVMPMPERSRPP